jgi:hypothetical protein
MAAASLALPALRAARFRSWILVTPGPFAKVVVSALPPTARSALTDEVDADLTHDDARAVHERIRQVLTGRERPHLRLVGAR